MHTHNKINGRYFADDSKERWLAHVIIVENLVQFLLNILLHLIFYAAALFPKV